MTATIQIVTGSGAAYDTIQPFARLAAIHGTSGRTITSFLAESTDGYTFLFSGSGFRFDADGNLIAGTVSGYTMLLDENPVLTALFSPRITSTRLWLAITDNEFEPVFGTLAHVITGGAGADWLAGQDGNDIVEGKGGADILDGGDNLAAGDLLTYASSLAGVEVSFLNIGAQSGGDAAGDIIANFENLTGSTNNDKLTGDGDANIIKGLTGDDTIDGHDGNDTLDGGLGIDTVSYLSVSDAVVVSLAKAGSQQTLGGDIDKLIGFENLTGSLFDDTLTGSIGVNTIHGDAGDDIIQGGKGADLLFGDANATDGDTVSYAASVQAVKIDLGVATQALLFGKLANGDAAGDVLSGFENVTGSGRNDELAGDVGNNVLSGGMGKDLLTGGLGEDTFFYSKLTEKGDRITDFVSGEDTLEFVAAGFKNAIAGDVNLVSGIGAGLVASVLEATFLYDTANGNLYFDQDGNGAAAKQLVLTLDGAPGLTALDIIIV